MFRHQGVRRSDRDNRIVAGYLGMQNALVTRLSGAVVRTTHLTGVVTDMGIETARWFRWWRDALSARFRVPLSFGRNPAERPAGVKLALLATIAGGFTLGAVAGAGLGGRSPSRRDDHSCRRGRSAVGPAFFAEQRGVDSIRPGPGPGGASP